MRFLPAMVAIPRWQRPCPGAASTTWEGQGLHALLLSIYGCDALEVPVALVEVEGAELGGSLEVLVVLAEVEGAEPGGSLEVPVVFAEVEGTEPGGGYIWWRVL